MSTKFSSVKIPDSELAVEMLKRKLVNESQLKAAIDYQESLGGRLLDILLKLGLVLNEAIDAFVRQLLRDEDSGDHGSGEGLHVDRDKLKVHKKLLEKVPDEVVKENDLLLFFPPPGTRAILVSANSEVSPELQKTLQNKLGIELYPIDIEEDIRARFLPEGAAKSGKKKSKKKSENKAEKPSEDETPKSESDEVAEEAPPSVDEAPEATEDTFPADEDSTTDESATAKSEVEPDTGTTEANDVEIGESDDDEELVESDHPILKALVNLLDRKGIVAKDELRVEVELLRRRGEL